MIDHIIYVDFDFIIEDDAGIENMKCSTLST